MYDRKTEDGEQALSLPQKAAQRKARTRRSYDAALSRYTTRPRLLRISWVTWIIAVGTLGVWGFTAYQAALAVGAHTIRDVLANMTHNAIDIQPSNNDAITTVLITYGAKDNALIIHGQYWRFITPVFLHLNTLHVGLNMFNFLLLGIFLERLVGHLRLLLLYIVCGMVSVITSFYFAPHEISVGASGAIFGLVGAYSIFVLVHRRAFRFGGVFAILWLIIVIGANLSVGFFVPDVDNYAHIGGLVSGCLLGWGFTPLYRESPTRQVVDMHSLIYRWPLALLTILGTLLLAMIALYLNGTKS